MNFTLYIDESGDFETSRGQWVLSGMLFAEGFDNCEKHLTNKFKSMPKVIKLKNVTLKPITFEVVDLDS
jgi:hypothetical protein